MVKRENKSLIFEQQFKIFLAAGIIWGFLELFLRLLFGTVLPTFLPLLVPFLIMLVVLTVKYFLPTPGTFLLMGILAASIQYLLSDEIFPNTLIIILAVSVIVEIVFLLFRFRTVSFIISGILISLYNMFHPLLAQGYLFEHVQFVRFRTWFADLFGYATSNAVSKELVFAVLIVLHILVGLLAGWLVIRIIQALKKKGYIQKIQVFACL
ncbi:MAG: hypothetical protein EH225_07295 [Calditrichaeota bacterium]|nr:ECF transporter S component [Calditrichota bacterium]RQW03316.1 MAG: hypothetical protein EH225_07295 [Calditrichota bacterium]